MDSVGWDDVIWWIQIHWKKLLGAGSIIGFFFLGRWYGPVSWQALLVPPIWSTLLLAPFAGGVVSYRKDRPEFVLTIYYLSVGAGLMWAFVELPAPYAFIKGLIVTAAGIVALLLLFVYAVIEVEKMGPPFNGRSKT